MQYADFFCGGQEQVDHLAALCKVSEGGNSIRRCYGESGEMEDRIGFRIGGWKNHPMSY